MGCEPPTQSRSLLQDCSGSSTLDRRTPPEFLPDRFAIPPRACPRQGPDKRDGNHRRSLNIRAILQAPLQGVVHSLPTKLPLSLHSLLLRSQLWLLRPLLLISLPLRQKLLQRLRSTRQPQPFLSAQEGLGPRSRHARTRQQKAESGSEGGDGSWVRSSRKTP